ncbi:ROK family transcriptional regulator [Lachnospiraceae bacterium JLR.KK008]
MRQDYKKTGRESNLIRIARYILEQGEISKNEIASALGLSMPTVLQCVKDLLCQGIIHESGEYESTGGRKAKTLSVVEDLAYSAGIEITVNHVSFVIIDMKANIIQTKRIRHAFSYTEDYSVDLAEMLHLFLASSSVSSEQILGVGISIPGIVISDENWLVISHVLNLKEIDLRFLSKHIPFPVRFENDAVCAAMAELNYFHRNMLYLSLSNSVGGAVFLNEEIYYGDHFRSAEFGHMVIEPGGKQCYCGKHGCMDAYCSAQILADYAGGDLEIFFQKLWSGEAGACSLWYNYLKYLGIAISNLRLIFDCDVILGGYVGSHLEPYLSLLWDYMQENLLFPEDSSFLRLCRFKRSAAGVGIAMYFINRFFTQIH